MAKRTVTFQDYKEPTWEEYTGEDPPANKWFTGTVKSVKYLEDDDQLMFVIEISDPDSPFKGWGRGWYAPFEGDQKWKLHEILRAIQGGKTTDVSLDWENAKAVETWLKKATPLKFQTQLYNDRITIRKVRPLMEAVPTAKAAAAAPAPVVEPDDAEVIEDYTEEELGEKTVAELKEILTEEFQKSAPRKKRAESDDDYLGTLIDAILDAQEEANAEEEAEPEADADEEDDDEFDDGFEEDADADEEEDEEEEEEPAPPARTRRSRTAAPAAKAAPAKAAPAASTRRRRS